MQIQQINNTVFLTKNVIVTGQNYRITQAKGKLNYIEICKTTNNPFGGRIGKDFKTFDDAQKHYKSPGLKVELLLCESEFNSSFKNTQNN